MRKIMCGNSFKVLPTLPQADAIITSLPDISDLNIAKKDYVVWFSEATKLCLQWVKPILKKQLELI